LRLAGRAIVIAALLATTTARADELRIATLAPEGSAWADILDGGLRKLSKATDGRVTYKIYAGASQGDERDMVRKLELGELDGAVLTSVGISLLYPGIRVLELPFLFESVDEVDYVRDKMWPQFEEALAAKGYALIARGDVGWSYIYSNQPIRSKSDLPKIKIWAWQDDPIVRAIFKRMKLNGVPLGVPEVLGALQSHRIDACYGPPLAAVALQWSSEVTHATSMPVTYSQGGVIVRAKWLEGLSAEDRAALDEIAADMGTQFVSRVRRDNKRAIGAMIKAGIDIVRTPPALATLFEADAKKVWKDLAGTLYTEDDLELVLRHLREFRAAKKKGAH